MANDDNYFDTDLSGIGLPAEGEGSIDLDEVLNQGQGAGEGEDSGEGNEGGEGTPNGEAGEGAGEEQEDDNLLDLNEILNQEEGGSSDADDNEGGNDNTPDEDNSGTPNNDTSSSQGNEGASPLTPFASLLHEQGVLPHLNIDEISKIENPEDVVAALIKGVQSEIDTANDEFVKSLPEEFHDMVEAYKEGVPFELLAQNKQTQLAYESITDDKLEEDSELQKRLVTDLMTAKGLKESRIKKLIERSDDLGELLEDAKEARDEIVEAQKSYAKQTAAAEKQRRQNAQEDYQKSLDELKESINGTEEIIPGMKVNKAIKDSTYKNMTEPAAYLENGQPVNFIMHKRAESKNPTLFDIRLNYLMEVTDGLTDFSKINATAETSATKKFLKNLDKTTSFGSGKPKNPGNKGDKQNMKSLLDSIK